MFAFALSAFALPAQAQIKCWTDANGKRVCGDAPPAGAKVTTLKNPSSAPAPAAAASKDGKDAKDAKKGPMTPAEVEQDFRKRQADAEKASAKADLEAKEAATKKSNCASAQDTLRSMESGRVQRIDAKGERVYLDDAQVQQETVKARQLVEQWCR
jgi:septal ring-binding cell division protein DamX